MAYPQKTILLDTLGQCASHQDYGQLHQHITELLAQEILIGIAAAGKDSHGLFYKYKINKARLFAPVVKAIREDITTLGLSGTLDISWYYTHSLSYWLADRGDLQKLDTYLQHHSHIDAVASIQQRSYDIFNDEKLLTKQGTLLLSRVKLTRRQIGIADENDPLMMAFHPRAASTSPRVHFIVENKAPYFRLLPLLPTTNWTTLICGYGRKIDGNISLLPQQCGFPADSHCCWYFGDFDWEGIRIWHSLTKQGTIQIRLAVPFYRKLLTYSPSQGKENQQQDVPALTDFLSHFSPSEQQQFRDLLANGYYYPQETLGTEDLADCIKELCL